MPKFTVERAGDTVVVRAWISIEEAKSTRDSLMEEYRSIPRLNQETFMDFHQWLLEEFQECAVQVLSSFKPAAPDLGQRESDDDSPSTFEPW
jgi:hypothetical protein